MDDLFQAFFIYGAAEMWGTIASALFNRKKIPQLAEFTQFNLGAFCGGGARLLSANVTDIVAVTVWAVGVTSPLFLVTNAIGIPSISPEKKIIGNDAPEHGGIAHSIDASYAAEKAAHHEPDHICIDHSSIEGSTHAI